jgi:hypothetical protein
VRGVKHTVSRGTCCVLHCGMLTRLCRPAVLAGFAVRSGVQVCLNLAHAVMRSWR